MKNECSDIVIHLIVESFSLEDNSLLLDFVDYNEYLQFIMQPYSFLEEYRHKFPYYDVWHKIEQAYVEYSAKFDNESSSEIKARHLGNFLEDQFERYGIVDRIIPPSKIKVVNFIPAETFDFTSECDSIYEIRFSRKICTSMRMMNSRGNSIGFVVGDKSREISTCLERVNKLHKTTKKLDDMENVHKLIYDMSNLCLSHLDLPKVMDLHVYSPLELVVKNVGQGNWNILTSCCRACNILNFDFGADTNISDRECVQLIQTEQMAFANKSFVHINSDNYKFDRLPGNYLVISHWHEDHINLVRFLSDKQIGKFDAIVIPKYIDVFYRKARAAKKDLDSYIPDKPLSSDDVFIRLWKNNYCNLYSFPDNAVVMSLSNDWAIGRARRLTDVNKQGLVMFIKDDSKVFVLTGDNSWNNIKDIMKILEDMNFDLSDCKSINLVVPHHGGKAGGLVAAKKYFGSKLNGMEKHSVISVGDYNRYHHPAPKYEGFVVDLGFDVVNTYKKNDDVILK